jgi:transportin-1
MNTYLQGIFTLANDSSIEVRREVCKAFVLLLEVRMEFLKEHMNSVILYLLETTLSPNEDLAIEACEFWSSMAEMPPQVARQYLPEFLPRYTSCSSLFALRSLQSLHFPLRLIPVLVKATIYSPAMLSQFEEEEEEDALTPDNANDVKPQFFRSKQKSMHNSNSNSSAPTEDFGDNSSDDDDDDDDDDENTIWNLRKCAAAALDSLAGIFNDEILQYLFPTLKPLLESQQWEILESGILVIGAVADGCLNGISPHLGEIFKFLVNTINHPKPLVRSITCWTFSRYISWIMTLDDIHSVLGPVVYVSNRLLASFVR